MRLMFSFLRKAGLAFLLFSSFANAQQLDQLRNLSPAQQQMLARQYGIDLPKTQTSQNSKLESPELVKEREQTESANEEKKGVYLSPFIDEYLKVEEDELKPYGYEIFSGDPTTFAPVSDAPVPASYIVGIGDQLNINVYGKENNQYQLVVDRSGNIFIPEIGPVNVAGKTFLELKSFVSEQVVKKAIGLNVAVSLGELRSIKVLIVGEAFKPGAYTVSSLATITQALFVAGGVTEIASLRNIQLKRAGKVIKTLDLYQLLMQGDSSNDAILNPGDVVFIPTVKKQVTISGEVVRPGIYELKNENSVNQALALAGGLKASGYKEQISITRFDKGEKLQLTANDKSNQFSVQNGDDIFVAPISSDLKNTVSLIGAVSRPGSYQWHEGFDLATLLNQRTSLLKEADKSYLLVLKEVNEDITVLQKDLTLPVDEWNTHLDKNDKVIVFSRFESKKLYQSQLDSFALTEEQIEIQEKQNWRRKIEEELFLKELGVKRTPENDNENISNEEALPDVSLINLSKEMQETYFEMEDVHHYSRKKLLTPVIERITNIASLSSPIKLVEVSGAVKIPGMYPLSEGASFSDMIKAAGGLSELALSDNAEITRITQTDKGIDISHISLNPIGILTGLGNEDIRIESKDRINVFESNAWQKEQKVTVKGEVRFPGTYTIKKGETLSQLIERVGGTTKYGDAFGAVFTRERIKLLEQENLRRVTEELRKELARNSLVDSGAGSSSSYSEVKSLLADLSKAKASGRLVIELPELLSGDMSKDLLLENGDELIIPKKSFAVNVVGEVFVPGSHIFNEALKSDDYVNKSGGFKELAAEDRAYIIKANGAVALLNKDTGFWFSAKDASQQIMPGDTIVVPLDAAYVDNMTVWKDSSQIIYQLAVTLAAIKGL